MKKVKQKLGKNYDSGGKESKTSVAYCEVRLEITQTPSWKLYCQQKCVNK